MSWRPAHELADEVLSESDLESAREHLLREPWPEKELKRLTKEYEERKHRVHTLPALIPSLVSLKAEWRYMNFGFQFRLPGNYLLCWWPRTRVILWQGAGMTLPTPLTVSEALDTYARTDRTVATPEPEPLPALPECPVCLVCGGPKAGKRCEPCNETPELCETCWPMAHWCKENR